MKLLILFLLSFNYLSAQQLKPTNNIDSTEILIAKIVITMDTLENVYLEFSKIKSIRTEDVLEVIFTYFQEDLKAIRKKKFEQL